MEWIILAILPVAIGAYLFKNRQRKTENKTESLSEVDQIGAFKENIEVVDPEPKESVFLSFDEKTKIPSEDDELRRSDGSALRDRLTKLTPTNKGLYPHEILLLHYATGYTFGQKKYQNFWYYRYLIPNVQNALHSLLERGFLTLGNFEDQIEKSSANNLKALLKTKGLKVSGKKNELVARVIENFDPSEVSIDKSRMYYALTELGKSELTENQYVLFVHRNSQYSMDRLNKMVVQMKRDYKECVIEELREHANEALKDLSRSKGTYWLEQYAIFCCEEKRFEEGFEYLCCYVQKDMNLSNTEAEDTIRLAIILKSALRLCFPYERGTPGCITSKIVDLFDQYKNASGLDEAMFEKALLSQFERFSIVGDYFKPDQLARIVTLELKDDIPALEKFYDEIADSIKRQLEAMPKENKIIREMFHDKYLD